MSGTDGEDDLAVLVRLLDALGPLVLASVDRRRLDDITSLAVWALGATAASVAVLRPGGEELEFVASTGPGAAETVGLRLPLARGIAGFAAVSGQTVMVDDVRQG